MNWAGGAAVGGFLLTVMYLCLMILWTQAIPCFGVYMWMIFTLAIVLGAGLFEVIWRRMMPAPPDQDDPPRRL